jgi:hypothetical protein
MLGDPPGTMGAQHAPGHPDGAVTARPDPLPAAGGEVGNAAVVEALLKGVVAFAEMTGNRHRILTLMFRWRREYSQPPPGTYFGH